MDKILHHLGWLKPYKYWDNHHPWWCRILSISSMNWRSSCSQTLDVQPKKHRQWAVRSQSCGIFSSQHWPRRDRYSRSVEWDKCEFETCAWWRYIASEPHDDWAAISSTKFLKAQNARSQDFHLGGFYTKCWVHNLQKVLWDKDDNKIRPCQKWETFEQVYITVRCCCQKNMYLDESFKEKSYRWRAAVTECFLDLLTRP